MNNDLKDYCLYKGFYVLTRSMHHLLQTQLFCNRITIPVSPFYVDKIMEVVVKGLNLAFNDS